jgi:hypothetical protein
LALALACEYVPEGAAVTLPISCLPGGRQVLAFAADMDQRLDGSKN